MADKEGQGQGKRSLEARADAFSRLKKHQIFLSYLNSLKILGCATNQDALLLASLWYVSFRFKHRPVIV